MDTRFLESFVSVVEQGSIAEAARRLNLTPAAVAQRIHALEKEIGARLCLRHGRTVKATEAGAAILDRARMFVSEVRDLKSIAATDRPVGILRLGALQSVLSGILPSVLTSLADKYPNIEVSIVRGVSGAELYQKVLDGTIDAAVMAQPPFATPKSCQWQGLRDEPLIVLAPALVSSRNPHAILTSTPFIRLDRNTWAGRLADGYLRKAGLRPRERFELDSLEVIAVLVDRGLGTSLVPDWAPPWPEGLSLKKLPLPKNQFTRRIGVLWSRASVRLRLVRIFVEQAVTDVAMTRNRGPRSRQA
jgi:DNA-binding transcriptional LysR family regulator